MSLAVRSARIEVFKPGNDSEDNPDFTIPEEDIASVSFSERLGQQKDEGTVEVHNHDGDYSPSLSDNELRSGDRLQFWITSEHGVENWGDESWGDGVWGGESDEWTAWIRDRKFVRHSPSISTIELTCEDFVFGVMSKRRVYNHFEDTQASGTSDSVLETVLDNEATEIGQDKIEAITENVNINSDGKTLLDVIIDLAGRADAYMYSRKTDLAWKSIGGINTDRELQGDDISAFENTDTDSGMVNRVRVDGGRSRGIDDEQLTQTAYTTVTADSRLEFQIETRKIALERLELWTKTTGSEEDITVRIQKSNEAGDGPIAPDDTTSDIDSRTLSHEFLSSDDFTTFIFGKDHELPEPDPWIIVETDGDTGQDIGVDGSGDPAYKAWYAYNITVRKTSQSSRRKYRLREERIKEKGAQSLEEALEIANAKLDHDSVPESKVKTEPESDYAKFLRLGDAVSMSFDRENVSGDYVVAERDLEYLPGRAEITLTLQEVSTI